MKDVLGKVAGFCLFSVVLCLSARADYLYWMVDSPTDTESNPVEFDYAQIRTGTADSAGTYLCLADPNEGTTVGQTKFWSDHAIDSAAAYTTGGVYADLAGTDPLSGYVIELWTGSGESAQKVAVKQITDVQQNIIPTSELVVGGAGDPLLAGSGFTPVPEPTSGLLLLIGFAGLALKRKRSKNV